MTNYFYFHSEKARRLVPLMRPYFQPRKMIWYNGLLTTTHRVFIIIASNQPKHKMTVIIKMLIQRLKSMPFILAT